jgi:hypothetical protein
MLKQFMSCFSVSTAVPKGDELKSSFVESSGERVVRKIDSTLIQADCPLPLRVTLDEVEVSRGVLLTLVATNSKDLRRCWSKSHILNITDVLRIDAPGTITLVGPDAKLDGAETTISSYLSIQHNFCGQDSQLYLHELCEATSCDPTLSLNLVVAAMALQMGKPYQCSYAMPSKPGNPQHGSAWLCGGLVHMQTCLLENVKDQKLDVEVNINGSANDCTVALLLHHMHAVATEPTEDLHAEPELTNSANMSNSAESSNTPTVPVDARQPHPEPPTMFSSTAMTDNVPAMFTLCSLDGHILYQVNLQNTISAPTVPTSCRLLINFLAFMM